MATITVTTNYFPGVVNLNVALSSYDGATPLANGTMVESPAGSGRYQFIFTATVATATYAAIMTVGTDWVDRGVVDIAAAGGVFPIVEEPSVMQSQAAGATINGFTGDALADLRAGLRGAIVTVTGPVSQGADDAITITLTRGDDYFESDGRSIEISLDGTMLPDLTGAACQIVFSADKSLAEVSGDVITPTGDSRLVRFEPTATQTKRLTPTVEGSFFVRLVTSTNRVLTPLEARGVLVVLSGKACCS